jgi:hypothetical protein
MTSDPPEAIPRREFVRSAVAIGGATALSACLRAETGSGDPADPEHPQGPDDLSALPERQHAWNDYLRTEPSGNTNLPEQQLVLFYEYTGSVPPTDDDRAAVEDALRSVERAYQRGTGGDAGATFNEGLLFTLGYAPSYFDRFDESVPEHVGLQRPEAVVETLDEDATPEPADAAMLLNSDYGSVVLSVEEALRDEVSAINGVAVEGDFASVFEQVGRRPAVVGRGNPAEELAHEAIEAESPLSMGYKSGFDDANPPEDAVTIDDGPFAGGTTQMVSRLGIDLDSWYELDEDDRVLQMFGTGHTHEEVGDTGEGLGGHSGVHEDHVENLDEKADEHGRLGHSQKLARARDEAFETTILRRSEGNVSDPDHDAGMNFTSVQRRIADFVDVRKAMNDLGGDIDPHHSGIVEFLTVERRGTYLLPPRSLRALPSPRPDRN